MLAVLGGGLHIVSEVFAVDGPGHRWISFENKLIDSFNKFIAAVIQIQDLLHSTEVLIVLPELGGKVQNGHIV